eukprot:879573-Amphidinium_carterae.1
MQAEGNLGSAISELALFTCNLPGLNGISCTPQLASKDDLREQVKNFFRRLDAYNISRSAIPLLAKEIPEPYQPFIVCGNVLSEDLAI